MKTIPLTKGLSALVDDEDYDRLGGFAWSAKRKSSGDRVYWYAVRYRKEKPREIYLHREILGFPKSFVDHENRNTLDCQKHNLRACDRAQNAANSRSCSKYGFKGVGLDKPTGKWRSIIRRAGRLIYLGFFDTAEDAARAYDAAAIKASGEFACTNQKLGLLNPQI